MVNFLTKDFIREQRQGLIYFILIILAIILVFIASYYTIDSYLELKLLQQKRQVVAQRNQKLKARLDKIEKIKQENTEIKSEIKAKQQQLDQMVRGEEVWEELSLLASSNIQIENFKFSEQQFSFSGVTNDMRYLNLLNNQLEATSLFDKFYLGEINKRKGFVFFMIEGQLQKKGE